MTKKAQAPQGLEAKLAELEQLVVRMEGGELPLDEALRSFERGVQLTRDCQQSLSEAQQKVQLLVQQSGGARLENFAAGDGDDAEPR